MPVKPMLGGIELQQVQKIETDEDQVLSQHSVPALEGDFLQRLGRRATRVTLSGVMTGADAAANLKTLRDKYREGVPVSFVADIATATKVDQVFIEEFGVRELAGKPSRFEYRLTLREMIPPPPPESEIPPTPIEPPPPPDPDQGTLVVEVIVEGEPEFDFSTVTVRADGTQENGTPISRVLTNRENNFWTEQRMPPGQYTAQAVVTEPEAMSGQAAATVRGGQTTQVQITLRRGVNIAKAFIIHFRFDSAFFEPCMREVLERVFTYAQAHPSEKIVVVGHTDKQGSDDYNQFLSERRARSVFAFLTFGTSQELRAAAITDWDQLWRGPSAGLHDNWDVREYQYMLQDLEYYSGDILESYSNTTDEAAKRSAAIDKTRPAVQAFQGDHSLPATGVMDAATWRALVTAYLEAGALEIAEDRFLRNANPEAGCDGGMLKWLGCGEQDPVRNTPDAWRPNRRVEILFVRVDRLPCQVPEPVTFNLPQPGAVNSRWCLGPGNVNNRHCFITRPREGEQPEPGKLQVVPAEPDRVTVNGTVKFDDGSPYANEEYVLIAPDGTFLHHNEQGQADLGEVASGARRGRGIPLRTDDQGAFNHPEPTPVGIYILQLPTLNEPAVARANEDPPETAIGNVICMHIESPGSQAAAGQPSPAASAGDQQSEDQQAVAPASKTAAPGGSGGGGGATIQRTRPAPVPVNPLITARTTVLVVKKTYTNPARLPITLRVSARFRRSGTLTRTVTAAGGNIRLFTAAQGGTEITFNGTDNVFTGNSLNAGVRLFAESDRASGALDDIQLTLTLAAGPTPVGAPLTRTFTAVALQLDVSPPRVAPAAFVPLPQPPAVAPAAGTGTDKWFGGVVLNQQDPDNNQGRGQLIVAQVTPAVFAGDLILRQVRVAGNNITGQDNKLQLFDNETPGPRRTPPAAEQPKANPFEFNTSTITPGTGRVFFIQGRQISSALRDTGYQLGIKNVDNDGDRIAATVAVTPTITLASPIVVVKKPHTNPARQLVTLRTTSPFNRNGTLTRSSAAIRFFTAARAGTEITFNGTDNVFTGAQLTAGVRLFAEGATASPTVNSFILTLTLDPGGPPVAGTPATARMTAVDLTLDVAFSRTAPGVEPPVMAQPPAAPPAPGTTRNDKMEPGRLTQMADSSFTHERAMLIVRPPNPLVTVTLELRPLNNRVSAFIAETPASGQTPISNPHTILSGIIPATGSRFFVEGTRLSGAAHDTGFQLGIQGLEQDGDRIAMTTVQIQITDAPTGSAAARGFARMGLWDHGFRANGTIFNDLAENDNFVGADTRNFHIRVRDVSAVGSGNVPIEWRTRDAANNDLDNPADKTITLVEMPANSGVFISRGLLLVSDTIDQNQSTHSGLAAPLPDGGVVRNIGESNHRVRLANMRGDVRMEYKRVASTTLPLQLPVFQRTPESRRRLPLQIFVLRVAAGSANAVIGTAAADPLWNTDIRILRETYARIGILVETVVAPGTPATDIVTVGGDSIVLIDPPAGVVPANVTFADETTIGTAHPALANTIRLFFVGGLASGNGGETWEDAIAAVGDPRRATAFTIQATGPYAAAHEVGHALSNRRAIGDSHYVAPTAPAGNRLHNDQNLMKRQFLGAERVNGPKRLWDNNDGGNFNQFTAMRGSHYTRNF